MACGINTCSCRQISYAVHMYLLIRATAVRVELYSIRRGWLFHETWVRQRWSHWGAPLPN